jgi:hypothetical protein
MINPRPSAEYSAPAKVDLPGEAGAEASHSAITPGLLYSHTNCAQVQCSPRKTRFLLNAYDCVQAISPNNGHGHSIPIALCIQHRVELRRADDKRRVQVLRNLSDVGLIER